MQQVAITEVRENGASIPREVLRALGVSDGDRVAFIANDDGSIALTRADAMAPKRPISDYIGLFATDQRRSLAEDLALLREMRCGEEHSA